MKKKLFARYFTSTNNLVPDHSDKVAHSDWDEQIIIKEIITISYVIAKWMEHHPEGKVDFIWL